METRLTAEWECRAEVERERAREQLQGAIDAAKAEFALRTQRLKAQAQRIFSPLHMSGCRLSHEQRRGFESLVSSGASSRSQVAELRSKAREAVAPPPVGLQLVLGSMDVSVETDECPKLRWVSFLCHNKDTFRRT